MNSIQNIGVKTKYNDNYNQQTTKAIVMPSFKGGTDAFMRSGAATRGIAAAVATILGFFGLSKLNKSTEKPEGDAAISETVVAEPVVEEVKNEPIQAKTNAAQKQEERLQARAEARRQAEIQQQEAKRAAKEAKIIAKFEEKGITGIKIEDNNTLNFAYQGITYRLTNTSSDDVNLYKLLNKVISDDAIAGKYTIKAVVNEQEYDCDWGFGENAVATENMFELLENNQDLLDNPRFNNIPEEFVKVMTSEEFSNFMSRYKQVALSTQKGKDYLESLKTSNPSKYIEIVTPEKLFETDEGKIYLKEYAPDKLEKLNKKTLEKRMKARVEEELDKLLPPASTISGVSYSKRVTRESKYHEGYYDYDTAPNGVEIKSSRFWVPGYYDKEQYEGILKYYYNGEECSQMADSASEEELLEITCKKIEKQRSQLRSVLEGIIRRNFAKGREDAPAIEFLDFKTINEPGYEDYERGHTFWHSAQTRMDLMFKFNGKTYKISRYNRSKEELMEDARKQVLAEVLYGTVIYRPIAIDEDYMDYFCNGYE